MTRHRAGSILAGLAALGYLGTAALHSTGYSSVVQLAVDVPSDLGRVMPALWLVFSFDLTVLGLMVGLIAWRPGPLGRVLLVIAALSPLGAAGLQLCFIGFVPPTAILLGVAALTIGAAAVLPPSPREAAASQRR